MIIILEMLASNCLWYAVSFTIRGAGPHFVNCCKILETFIELWLYVHVITECGVTITITFKPVYVWLASLALLLLWVCRYYSCAVGNCQSCGSNSFSINRRVKYVCYFVLNVIHWSRVYWNISFLITSQLLKFQNLCSTFKKKNKKTMYANFCKGAPVWRRRLLVGSCFLEWESMKHLLTLLACV